MGGNAEHVYGQSLAPPIRTPQSAEDLLANREVGELLMRLRATPTRFVGLRAD